MISERQVEAAVEKLTLITEYVYHQAKSTKYAQSISKNDAGSQSP